MFSKEYILATARFKLQVWIARQECILTNFRYICRSSMYIYIYNYSVVSMFHIMLKQHQRAGEPNGICASFFSSETQDTGQSLLGHVKWPQPAPLWHVVPWPMPIYEQVQNVRYHLLRPCAGRCQACRACLHLLCLLFCCSTLPAREEPRPDSKGRLPSVWCRAWWSEMTAWSAGPTRFNGCRFWWVVRFGDPTNEQSSQSVSQQPFLGILGEKTSRNDQRFTLAKVNLCPLVVKLRSIGYNIYIYSYIYIYSINFTATTYTPVLEH